MMIFSIPSSSVPISPWACRGSRMYTAVAAWRWRRARWWSTPRRAGAARIPGCWARDPTRASAWCKEQPKMLSRVANSIYWMSRYMERAENVARFINVNLHLNLDLPEQISEQWAPLVNITGDRKLFDKLYKESTRENV